MAEEDDPRLEDGEMDVEAHISWALGVVGEVSLGDVVLAGEPHPSLLPSLVTREQHREQEQERRCRYEVEAERRGGSHTAALQHCRHDDNMCRHSGVHGL